MSIAMNNHFLTGRVVSLVAIYCLAGCSATTAPVPPRLVGPEGRIAVDWTPDELAKNTATRILRKTEQSTHLVLTTVISETPHVHDRTDLTAILQTGSAVIHLGTKAYTLQSGDVLHIPRGTPHWLELTANDRVTAYVVFTPPFDPTDHRLVDL